MLGHKTSFNNFKRIEIISSIFFLTTQCETRNQLQEKMGKNNHMESKQHSTKTATTTITKTKPQAPTMSQ